MGCLWAGRYVSVSKWNYNSSALKTKYIQVEICFILPWVSTAGIKLVWKHLDLQQLELSKFGGMGCRVNGWKPRNGQTRNWWFAFLLCMIFFSLILYIQIFGIAWVFHDRVLDSGWKKACTSTIVFWIHFFTNNLPFFTSIPVHCIEDHWSHAKIWPSSCCIWSLFLGFLNPQMQMDGGPGSLSPRRLSAIIKPKLRQETERHNRSLVSNCGALEGRSNFRIGFFWLAKIPRKRNQMQPNKTPGRPVALHSVCKTSTTSRCTLT